MPESTGLKIGTAYLEIIPSMQGFGANLRKQVDTAVRSTSDTAGKQAGASLGKSFMSAWADESKKEGSTVRSRIVGVLNNAELSKVADDAGARLGQRLTAGFNRSTKDATKGLDAAIAKESKASAKESGGGGSSFGLVAGASLAGNLGVAAVTSLIGVVKSYAGQAAAAADATLKFQSTLKFAGIKPDQINQVTAATQKYADQTVYDLDDIQSMTAQLASNGVKNYEQLAEAAGNLNAVAGGNADTFKSVGMVMSQTAGAGKLTTDNWNQLADAIPGASGKLQEAMLKNGAYTGNFRKAMENGQISAQEFNKAVLQLGSTDIAKSAATSTQTFEGAWGNLQATIVGGLSKLMTTLRPAVTTVMGLIANVAGPVFSGINKGLQFVIDGLSRLGKYAQASGILGAFSSLGARISGVFATIKQDVSDFVAGVTLSDWSEQTYGELDGFVAVGQNVRNALLQVKGAVSAFISGVSLGAWGKSNSSAFMGFAVAGAAVRVALEGVIHWFTGTFLPAFLSYEATVRGLVETVARVVGQIIAGLVTRITPMLPMIRNVFVQIGAAVSTALELMKLVIQRVTQLIMIIWRAWGNTLLNFAAGVFRSVLTVISGLLTSLQGVFKFFIDLLHGRWGNLWRDLLQIASGIMRALVGVVSLLWVTIKGLFWTGVAAVKLAWNGLWALLKSVASATWGWLQKVVLNPIVSFFTHTIPNALGKFGTAFSNVWGDIKAAAAKPVNFVINTVWNNGLRKALNMIPTVNLGEVSPIPGYRKGGYTGNAGPDTVAGVVHGNEFVMDAETTRLGGGKTGMEKIRQALRRGGIKGDIFDTIERGPKGPGGQGGGSDDAIGRGWAFSHTGEDWYRKCLNFVNRSWGGSVPRLGLGTARESANAGPLNPVDIPPPAAAVYLNSPGYAGHVALSVGGGNILTTDYPAKGHIGLTSVGQLVSAWGAPYMGWWHPELGVGGKSNWGKVKGFFGNAAHNVGSAASWLGNKAVAAGSWVGDKAAELFDFGPVKALIHAVEGKAASALGGSPWGKLIGQAVPTMVDKALHWGQGKADAANASASFSVSDKQLPISGNLAQWVKTALPLAGLPDTPAYEQAWERQAMTESSGNPNAVQGNIGDINNRTGDLAKGLVQVISSTFRAYALPGHSQIFNPVDNLIAGMRYAASRYGTGGMLNAIGHGHGYANGTYNASAGYHDVAEKGMELVVGRQTRKFRGGEQVLTSEQTARLLGSGNSGNHFDGCTFGSDPDEVARAIEWQNRSTAIRAGLGSVALGV